MWADSESGDDVDGGTCYIIASEIEADWWFAEAGDILSFWGQNQPNIEFFISQILLLCQ